MDQPAPVSPPTVQPNNPKPPPKKPNLPLNRKTLLIGLAFVALILLIPLILLSTKQKSASKPIETAKTWEIILNYNRLNQTLSLKKLSILQKDIKQDFRGTQDSPYEVVVVDKTARALFRNKINITQQFIIEPGGEPTATNSSQFVQPLDLETILYIPYQPTATKIAINKDYAPVLDINVPPLLSFNLVPEAFAQTASQSCGPIQAVFISDGYSDLNIYHQQVAAIENRIKSTAPYSSQPAMFDFKMIDNQQPLGCTQGLRSCLMSPSKLFQVGYNGYPSASKFIVLVNLTNPAFADMQGVTNDIGGNFAMLFTNYPGKSRDHYIDVAAHEFLGHAVGQLYDRYVGTNYVTYNPLKQNIKSNCTDNSQGEGFWKQAGAASVFKGCSNPNLYAPFPLSCTNTNPNLISAGSPQTIMSADGCGSNTFDSVETAWITQKILPQYAACSSTVAGPAATTAPLPTTPAATLAPNPNGNYPTAKFVSPPEGLWIAAYVGFAKNFQAVAQAPAGRTLTELAIYRVPANTYATSGESWVPIGTTTCNSATCTINTSWTPSQTDRQTYQEWYLTLRATDSSGIKCDTHARAPFPYTDRVTGASYYSCYGGSVNVQVLTGTPPASEQTLPTPTQTQSGPTPTQSASTTNQSGSGQTNSSGASYVCEEVPSSGSGSNVQIHTLNCRLIQ